MTPRQSFWCYDEAFMYFFAAPQSKGDVKEITLNMRVE